MSTSNNNEDDGASPTYGQGFAPGEFCRTYGRNWGDGKENFDFEEGDFTRTIVNRIPAINFSNRNRVSSLWWPSKLFQFIDVENGYFFVQFQSKENYEKVFTQGPWTVFSQYLMVQPWSRDFNPLQPFPMVVVTWIQLPGLPGYLYNKKILEEIGGMIDRVVKLDFKTDKRLRGQFV
ncbi:hypothetical protein Gohar_024029 [Gossypium harknessii]|uniref:DUF4283 domain-containing protein n=1 Tax=Gossypium harknessii TaxID=34285 RepID=A0A7J9HEL7_9ROSI|nr:hypothetical protein [Gossypium harknessii]